MKKTIYKKFIIFSLIFLTGTLPVFSLELDMSVDEEIKKKYNSSKLEYEVLPSLPKVNSTTTNTLKTNTQTTIVPKTLPKYSETSTPTISKIDKKDAIKIPKWTKLNVKSNQIISDWLKAGNTVSFTTTTPVYKKYITIPAGTKLYGIITDAHRPQKTGNGGLVVLKITSMTYQGKTYTVNGKITKANSRKIFFNNIKGKRQYWSGVGKQIDKGENFYKKTKNTSSKMADNPVLIILSPIPAIVGIAGYSVCTVLSPLTGLTTKGGNLYIPSGSLFEIKLLDNAYIY